MLCYKLYLDRAHTIPTQSGNGEKCDGQTRGRVLTYFSVRGRAAEQGIIFRILTPGQGIIFVQIGSMTGSIFVIYDSERSF